MNARESTDGGVVILDRGEYTTCSILLQGCSILSWRICNEEQIFVSRITPFSHYKNIRGGVRIIWPHHKSWSFGRHHGFGRDIIWTLKRGPEYLPNGDVFVDICVSSDNYTKSMWAFEFVLNYRVTLHEKKLTIKIVAINPSKYFDYDFNIMIQCYIKVQDLDSVRITGLKNCLSDDLLSEVGASMSREKNEEIKVVGNVDRLFQETPSVVNLYADGNKLVKITKHNIPDLKIWNPGEEKAKELKDLDDDEFKYFVAIEGGYVVKKQPLRPRSTWEMLASLEVINTNEKKKKYKNFYDFFDGYC